MSLDTFNNDSFGLGMGYLPGSINPVGEGNQATISGDHVTLDSLSPSEQQAILAYFFSSNPTLQMPSYDPNNPGVSPSISGIDFGMYTQAKLSQIGSAMLDKWSESLAQQAELQRQYLNSPAYQVWLDNNTATGVARQEAAKGGPEATQPGTSRIDNSALAEVMSNYSTLVKNQDPAAVGALPFALATFVIPSMIGGGLTSGVVDVASTRQVAVNPSVDTSFFNNVAQNAPVPQDDMRAELGLLGALFAGNTLRSAEAQNTLEALGGQKPHNAKQLAENYAAKIDDLINNPQFDQFLGAIFSQRTNANNTGQVAPQGKMEERIAVFKMVLLSTALMALYASEAKHMSRGDFLGMINGTTQPKSDLEAKLVKSFQDIRDSGLISAEAFNQMMDGLAAYADSNPDFKSFFNVDSAFKSISERIVAERENQASIPIHTPS